MRSEFALTEEDMKTSSVLSVLMDKGVETIEDQLSISEKEVMEDKDEENDFDIDASAPASEDVIDWLGFDPDEFMDSLEYGDPLLE
jgi:hypothetical protein